MNMHVLELIPEPNGKFSSPILLSPYRKLRKEEREKNKTPHKSVKED